MLGELGGKGELHGTLEMGAIQSLSLVVGEQIAACLSQLVQAIVGVLAQDGLGLAAQVHLGVDVAQDELDVGRKSVLDSMIFPGSRLVNAGLSGGWHGSLGAGLDGSNGRNDLGSLFGLFGRKYGSSGSSGSGLFGRSHGRAMLFYRERERRGEIK